jgi:beta-phosphoglucomutase-like phosphatase (HAD superfamily)
MIRAFVFDLDGTLVETEELKALSYARAAAELCPDLNEAEVSRPSRIWSASRDRRSQSG